MSPVLHAWPGKRHGLVNTMRPFIQIYPHGGWTKWGRTLSPVHIIYGLDILKTIKPPPLYCFGSYFQVSGRDTVDSVALQFGSTPSQLMRINHMHSRMIFPGQVSKGLEENLWRIHKIFDNVSLYKAKKKIVMLPSSGKFEILGRSVDFFLDFFLYCIVHEFKLITKCTSFVNQSTMTQSKENIQ